MLSQELETNELVITGPAHRTLTENKFRRKMPEFLYQLIGLTNAMRGELSPCLRLPETPSQVSMETTPDGTS